MQNSTVGLLSPYICVYLPFSAQAQMSHLLSSIYLFMYLFIYLCFQLVEFFSLQININPSLIKRTKRHCSFLIHSTKCACVLNCFIVYKKLRNCKYFNNFLLKREYKYSESRIRAEMFKSRPTSSAFSHFLLKGLCTEMNYIFLSFLWVRTFKGLRVDVVKKFKDSFFQAFTWSHLLFQQIHTRNFRQWYVWK